MRVLPFLLVSVVAILNVAFVQAAKGKSTVAVPRKVKGNAISRSVFGSMFSRAFREMKVTFCSELEALTLQVTSLYTQIFWICLSTHDSLTKKYFLFCVDIFSPNIYCRTTAADTTIRYASIIEESRRAYTLFECRV